MAYPDDSYWPIDARISAVIAYIVLLMAALIGNAVLFGINLVDFRQVPGRHTTRINMSQIAIGLPCLANLAVGTFAVAWFTYVGIAGSDYLRPLKPACSVVTALFVWTSVVYLTGLLTMAVDRVIAVHRHRLRMPDGDEDDSVQLTARGVWLTVIGFCLYATTVSVILTASGSRSVQMSLLCTVHVDYG